MVSEILVIFFLLPLEQPEDKIIGGAEKAEGCKGCELEI